jgi:tetratricopeptide (TPR) repeat protein
MLITGVENMMLIGQDREAADLLTETLRLVPWYSDLKPHLGMALARLGKFAEAEKWLAGAVKERTANSAYAAFILGQIRYNRGDLRAAEKAWRDSAKLDPSYSDPHYYLGVLMRNIGREKEALAEFAEAVRLAPDKPEYDGVRRELGGK